MTTTMRQSRGDRLRYFQSLRDSGKGPPFQYMPHQMAPDDDDWFFWLLEAGRGAGKTAAAAHHIQEHLNGPPCISDDLPHRALIIAPTIGDGIESADLNDQALTRLEPRAVLRQSGGGSRVDWPNGSQVRVVGTHSKDDIERLRAAGNTCLIWAEELAAWRYLEQAWELMMFGLRLGPKPRIIGTTTPKARPEYIAIREQADYISHATTLDNPNLNEGQRQRLFDMYDGTSIGQQELHGLLIEEAEGAIWSSALIDEHRLDSIDTVGRTVVAIDPPGGATEAGIVTAALLPDCQCGAPRLPHYAILADDSGKLTPEGWGARAVNTYHELGADRIVGEVNYGGDMVEAIVRQADRTVAYEDVRATRGKRVRAEPVKGLYEQGRVHHIGAYPELEMEMVQWIPDESSWSPNRLDALVWAVTYLSQRGDSQWWSA